MGIPSHHAEPQRFRQVLGHFASGVTVITGMHEGEPAGFACQAFAALSLDPPLVLFCPGKSSGTWPLIARIGSLGESVVGDPLLFYRGRFTLSATTDGDSPPEVVDTMLSWPRFAD